MTTEERNKRIEEQINYNTILNTAKRMITKYPWVQYDLVEDIVNDSYLWLLTIGKEMFEDQLEKGYGPKSLLDCIKKRMICYDKYYNSKECYSEEIFKGHSKNDEWEIEIPCDYEKDSDGTEIFTFRNPALRSVPTEDLNKITYHKHGDKEWFVQLKKNSRQEIMEECYPMIDHNRKAITEYIDNEDNEITKYVRRQTPIAKQILIDRFCMGGDWYCAIWHYYQIAGTEIPYSYICWNNVWGNMLNYFNKSKTKYRDYTQDEIDIMNTEEKIQHGLYRVIGKKEYEKQYGKIKRTPTYRRKI